MANREENLKKINAELEQLSDEELEKVAGGGFSDIIRDGMQLYLRGKLSFEQAKNPALIAETLHGMGYSGYKQTELLVDNIYTDRSGNVLSGSEFWKKFGEENGAEILKDREATLDKDMLDIAYITKF